MIVDVPNHEELEETASGWLNLAWGIALNVISTFQEHLSYYEKLEREMKIEEDVDKQRTEYWRQERYRLNNAITLLQQSVELFLKAKIAQTSPYLLMTGDPQTWPKINSAGQVSFSEFRTIDASQLLRAAEIASHIRVNSDFKQFFERMRAQRNRIVHLDVGNAQVAASKILIDILVGYHHLFPVGTWIEFRKKHLVSGGNFSPVEDYEDDIGHSNFLHELRVATTTLENRFTKKFFGFDKRKKRLFCPMCKYLQFKHDDSEPNFAQRVDSNTISCIACSKQFTNEEYESERAEWE